MITRNNRIEAAGLAISLMLLSVSPFCLAVSAEGDRKSPTTKLSKAEIMVKRLGKGINVDAAPLEEGPPMKVLHDPAQYDAVKAAGFQSVRTRDGKLDARELFDDEGFITEQMIHFHGGNTPDVHWFFEGGVPQKLVTQILDKRAARQGPGTYEKQNLDWVKVK